MYIIVYINMYMFLYSDLFIINLVKKIMDCLLCGKELEEYETDFCDACFRVLKAKYPQTKLQEVIKCHKKHAKKLKR